MLKREFINCAQDENPELFYQIPWSHGTLGFLVAAELKIIPAKKYVKVTYQPIYDEETLCQKIQEESNKEENDFVEGLAYSLNESVLMTSLLTDHCEEDKVSWFLELNLIVLINCFGIWILFLREIFPKLYFYWQNKLPRGFISISSQVPAF